MNDIEQEIATKLEDKLDVPGWRLTFLEVLRTEEVYVIEGRVTKTKNNTTKGFQMSVLDFDLLDEIINQIVSTLRVACH